MRKNLRRLMTKILIFVLVVGIMAEIPTYKTQATEKNAETLIGVALGQLGNGYDSNGNTKYGSYCGYPSTQWCVAFISWCANQAGISEDIIPKEITVSVMHSWFKQRGLETSAPQRGDIGFFNNDTHAVIVTGVSGNKVYTVEGNTKDWRTGKYVVMCCDDNTGSTYHAYARNLSDFSGFGRPNYYTADPVDSEFPLIDGGIYKIRSVNSGLVVDIPGGTSENSVGLQQWDDGGIAHEFKAIRKDDGYVFQSVQNGKVWDMYMGYTTEGTNLTQYDYNDSSAQHYKLVNRGNGRYSIHPACSNLALDVEGGSKDNGGKIKQYAYHGGNNQLWTFEYQDKENPVVSNVQITNLSSDGYKVTCTVTDNVGVAKVCFPTWTEANGQDDLAGDWGTSAIGTCEGGNTYSYWVKVSDHNNEGGRYITHVYAFDTAGNYSYQEVTADVVRNVPLESFSLNASALNLNINQIQTLTVQAYVPSNTTSDKTASWNSSDSTVASVDANGAVRGLKKGTAVITCTIAGKTQTCQVSVSDYVEQSYSDWTETLPTEVTNNPTLYQVEEKTQYHNQTKSETTSTTPNLSGWTVSNEWWGDWQSCGSDVTGTATREVKSEQQYVKTQYSYMHYHNYSTGRLSPVQYSAQWVYEETGWLDYALTAYGTSNAGGTMYRGSVGLGPCSCKDCWYNQTSRDVYNTLYYYRDKYFHYYRWSDWSGWTDQELTASDNVNVETRKLYRYRYVGPQIISQPADQTAALGEKASFEIGANGQELTYQWQTSNNGGKSWVNSGLTGNKTNVLKVDVTSGRDGYQFRCVLTDKNGNQLTSDAAKLNVRYVPVAITSQPKNQEAEEGKTASFTVGASGSGLSYQWQASNNGGKSWANSGLTGNKTSTLQVAADKGRDGYQFRCIVTDRKGKSVTSTAATLRVIGEVKITSQPKNQEAEEGKTASFTVGASGSGLSYQWQASNNGGKSWANSGLTGNKTSTLQVAADKGRDGYQFRCIVTDRKGKSVTSTAATLRVIGEVKITSQPKNQEAEEGKTASFTVGASGSGLSYQWQASNNGGKSWANSGLTGNKTSTLQVAADKGRDGYQFRCIVTDKNGKSVVTDAVTLHVKVKTQMLEKNAEAVEIAEEKEELEEVVITVSGNDAQ